MNEIAIGLFHFNYGGEIMSTTRKPRVPMSEQIRLINECRQSGLTDADWCREHNIAPSTFYNWVNRCRKASADEIAEPHYGHTDKPRTKQDVVPVSIVQEHFPAQAPEPGPLSMTDMHLDNSHTIEVVMSNLTIRVNNEADPVLLTRMIRLLRETLC